MFWIFVVPYNIPGERNREESPLDIIRKRPAARKIADEQYAQNKAKPEDEPTRAK